MRRKKSPQAKGKTIAATKGKDNGSSRELPTIVEDEVSGVEDLVTMESLKELKQEIRGHKETVMVKIKANTDEVHTLSTILGQHSKVLEALAHKVSILERQQKVSPTGNDGDTKIGIKPFEEGKACASELRPLKRRLDYGELTDDVAILYLIHQKRVGTPFAFYHHKGLVMLGEETPWCLELSFRPPVGMRFDGDNLAVATYIFALGMEDSERLVEDSHCDGTRKRLLSLKPGCELYDDVINMVVGMCTGEKRQKKLHWWLPTTFSHMILNPNELHPSIMEYIKQRYMGFADELTMIYVPMHIGFHWYLMIVDIWEKKLIYLDSCKSTEETETARRISQMREVARYIGMLIRCRSFWDNTEAFPPLISEFEPEEYHTGQQAPGSYNPNQSLYY
ncbi:hypothetical protein PIB30_008480 [Stylosanthes scabra]|uniref:Ubiquitin-like protease family profile domain-containing protein n=1 Tax=Stylosanthes scabra TaxID=79078 RepID=A0ABU6Y2W8_9FABA|nr:hypothetical protein [Stylosanthes scabra]